MKYFLLLFVTLVTLGEVFLRVAIKGDESLQVYYKKRLSKSDEVFIEKSGEFPYSTYFSPSPFLGVTYNKNLKGVKSHGLTKGEDDARLNLCRVGIFGGSVAEQFGKYLVKYKRKNLEAMKEALRPCADRKIIIEIFSEGSFKQPQQYIAFSTLGHNLDMAINLDGFNEIFLDPGIHYPAYFPYLVSEMYYLNEEKLAILKKIKSTLLLEKRLTKLMADNPTFGGSHLLNLFFKSMERWSHQRRRKLRRTIRRRRDVNSTERIKERANTWERYTRLQGIIGKSQGIDSFYFIQPNIHVKGSKILSNKEEELLELDKLNEGFKSIDHSYRLLRKSVEKLKNEDVTVYNLELIFKDTKKTLYTDNCCHVNVQGNDILFREIFNRINTYYKRK